MPPKLGRALALCSVLARGLATAGGRHPLHPPPAPAFLLLPTTLRPSSSSSSPSPSSPRPTAGWLSGRAGGGSSSSRSSSRTSTGSGAMGAGCSSSSSSRSRRHRRFSGQAVTATTGGGGGGANGGGAVSSSSSISSAPVVELDRSLFASTRTLQAIRVPAARCNEVIRELSPYLFRTNRIRSVVLPAAEGGSERRLLEKGQRLVLLQTEDEVEAAERRREEGGASRRRSTGAGGRETLSAVLGRVVASVEGSSVVEYEVELGYDDLPLDQVLRRLLPPGVEAPSAFETVGHIAHLNLRPEVLPYQRVVAQAILDRNPRLRTVVNKVASLDAVENPFRVLPLEVIGGEAETRVEVKEGGATFRFDFAEVYWNSRLQTEHARLVDLISGPHPPAAAAPVDEKKAGAAATDGGGGSGNQGSKGKGAKKGKGAQQPQQPAEPPRAVVWDVFAGVGPFAVPLAMRGCRVHANDLNGRSHHYLCLNALHNKVHGPERLVPSNLDGRVFLRALAEARTPCDHVIMNLPATAIDFLDVFAGAEGKARFGYLLEGNDNDGGKGGGEGPTLHVYCFSKAADPERDALDRAATALGLAPGRRLEKATSGDGDTKAKKKGVRIHHVRDVAPKKPMLCLSFPLRLAWAEE